MTTPTTMSADTAPLLTRAISAATVAPLAVLLALSAGTILAGIIGAIPAVPFVALAWAIISTWRETPPSPGPGDVDAPEPTDAKT